VGLLNETSVERQGHQCADRCVRTENVRACFVYRLHTARTRLERKSDLAKDQDRSRHHHPDDEAAQAAEKKDVRDRRGHRDTPPV
jgi:hypothetical protein